MDNNTTQQQKTKFCTYCGEQIAKQAVICPKCGCQVEQVSQPAPQININNANQSQLNGAPIGYGKLKNKWAALALCVLGGVLGFHKFYEGKIGMGIFYLFTLGICGIGVVVDFIALLFKPTHYYV